MLGARLAGTVLRDTHALFRQGHTGVLLEWRLSIHREMHVPRLPTRMQVMKPRWHRFRNCGAAIHHVRTTVTNLGRRQLPLLDHAPNCAGKFESRSSPRLRERQPRLEGLESSKRTSRDDVDPRTTTPQIPRSIHPAVFACRAPTGFHAHLSSGCGVRSLAAPQLLRLLELLSTRRECNPLTPARSQLEVWQDVVWSARMRELRSRPVVRACPRTDRRFSRS